MSSCVSGERREYARRSIHGFSHCVLCVVAVAVAVAATASLITSTYLAALFRTSYNASYVIEMAQTQPQQQSPVTGSCCIYGSVKYTKDPVTHQPVYEFPIKYTGDDIIIDAEGHPALDVLITYLSHDSVVGSIMSELVAANKGIFAKPYTASQLLRITTHKIGRSDANTGSTWKCIPVRVILNAGKFSIIWDLHALDVPLIDLGDIAASRGPSRASSPVSVHASSRASSPVAAAAAELVDVTQDVMAGVRGGESGADVVTLRSPEHIRREKERERKRIEEARLRAKVAVLRAEKVIQKYIDRYGDDLSDSEDDLSGSEDEYYSDTSSAV